jgi:hypothetical protein
MLFSGLKLLPQHLQLSDVTIVLALFEQTYPQYRGLP